ncbi:MAG: hypothetical protein JNJ80_23570 [Gemmatimonadetes bacterium]|nr:hypothetical protein [Gemmatimonadota bacterium]
MKTLVTLALLLAFALPAVAQDSTSKSKPKRRPDVISIEEIDAIRTEVATAHDIVQRLRPNFLRGRGPTSTGSRAVPLARVVVDGTPRGEVDLLKQIPAMTIREVRYLKATDASVQFGTGYDGGAILVFTRIQ